MNDLKYKFEVVSNDYNHLLAEIHSNDYVPSQEITNKTKQLILSLYELLTKEEE